MTPRALRRASWAFLFFLPLNVVLSWFVDQPPIREVPVLPNLVGWIVLGTAIQMLPKSKAGRLRFLQIIGLMLSLPVFIGSFPHLEGFSIALLFLWTLAMFLEGAAGVLVIWHISTMTMRELEKMNQSYTVEPLEVLRFLYPVWLLLLWMSWPIRFNSRFYVVIVVGALIFQSIILVLIIVAMCEAAIRMKHESESNST